jgi:hypothetical protein
VEKVVFADSWQGFFEESGLVSFDDLFNYSAGERINKNNKREVIRFAFGSGLHEKQFFMKRFINPHFKDMVSAWRNFGTFCSQGRAEWENAKLLLGSGIGTYEPACYGEQRKCGIERNSFIITEKLQARPLTDFVAQKWCHLTSERKESIIRDIGAFVRKIHNLNVSLPDLYIWHIFIRELNELDEYQFAVIDLHRMKHNVTDKNEQIENLGRLDHSMLDRYFDDAMRRLLIESYAGCDWPGDIAKLSNQVKKQSDRVSCRRRRKQY